MNYKKNDIIEISFDLSIDGTSKKPSEVRAIFIFEDNSYGTIINNLEDNKWNGSFNLASINNLQDGSNIEMIIEVVLNGKLYKPVKKTVSIIGEDIKQITADNFHQELKQEIANSDYELVKSPEIIAPLIKEEVFKSEPNEIKLDLFKTVIKQQEKKTIKFDKPLKVKCKQPISEMKLEVSPIQFSIPSKKKKLAPKIIEEAFVINEDKIIYL